MLKQRLAALCFAVAACASAPPKTIVLPTVAYPFDKATLLRDDVIACSEIVLSRGWEGRAHFERAAFLRIDGKGGFSCDVWPAGFQFHHAHWSGATPDGTVAVIHSHPRSMPDPSDQDIDEARRLGIPMIVVTPDWVTMVKPHNGMIVRVPYDSMLASRR